jgi:DNA-binding response OmpR family regulator
MQYTRPCRILIIEDDRVTAELNAELLRNQGYETIITYTPEEALDQISHSYFDIVIIDLRLRDNADTDDRSGLELAAQIDPSIQKIILTLFPNHRDSVRALEQAANRRSLAVKFINKEDGDEALSAAVADVLSNGVFGNRQLQIRWAERGALGAPRTITAITDQIVNKADEGQMSARKDEITDLLQRLFADYTRISIERLFPAASDWAALEVHAFRGEEDCGAYLVILGHKATLKAAEQRLAELKNGNIVPGTLIAEPLHETPRYLGLRLRVSGLQLERCIDLRDFYLTNKTSALLAAFESLYNVTLLPLHQRQIALDRQCTMRYYQTWLSLPEKTARERLRHNCKSIANWLQRLQACRLNCDQEFITIQWPDDNSVRLPFPSGAFNIEGMLGNTQSPCGYINGRVNLDSVLIDPQTRVCLLSDITGIEMGPLFIDMITLSISLRSSLSEAVSLAERFQIEQQLIGASSLNSSISVEGAPEIDKFLKLNGQLRQQAARLGIEQDPRAYLLGLFFASIHTLLTYQPDRNYSNARRLWYGQILLCATLLYQRLNNNQNEPIHIDENHRVVSIGEQKYPLTDQRFRLFCYLYERRGKVCSYKDLLRDIFDYKQIDAGQLGILKRTLQTAINRLQKDIGDDLRPIKYIDNQRDLGYIFKTADDSIP